VYKLTYLLLTYLLNNSAADCRVLLNVHRAGLVMKAEND